MMTNECPETNCKFRKQQCHYPPHVTNTEVPKRIIVCKHFGKVVKSEVAYFRKEQ